jgi:hypothetical protein
MRLESNMEWGIPVLYSRTGTCVLFEGAAAAETVRPQPPPEPSTDTKVSTNREQAREELRRLFA